VFDAEIVWLWYPKKENFNNELSGTLIEKLPSKSVSVPNLSTPDIITPGIGNPLPSRTLPATVTLLVWALINVVSKRRKNPIAFFMIIRFWVRNFVRLFFIF
jgi:hypothetical protein